MIVPSFNTMKADRPEGVLPQADAIGFACAAIDRAERGQLGRCGIEPEKCGKRAGQIVAIACRGENAGLAVDRHIGLEIDIVDAARIDEKSRRLPSITGDIKADNLVPCRQ